MSNSTIHGSTSSSSPQLPPLPSSIPIEIRNFIASLHSNGIKCVTFDLDRTLVTNHSGGSVPSADLSTFTSSLTPTVRQLLPLLVSQGFHIAVATFADDMYATFHRDDVAGVELVEAVLSELPLFKNSPDLLHSIPIVTINPDLYDKKSSLRAQSSALQSAALEEQKRMKSSAISESSSTSSLQVSPSSSQSPLHTFFQAKLNAFGISPSHPEWSRCAAYPPLPYKNIHLTWISTKLGLSLRELILVDDRDENCLAAIEYGAWGLFMTGPKRGLRKEDLHNMKPPNEGKM